MRPSELSPLQKPTLNLCFLIYATNRIYINGQLTVSDARTDYFLTSNTLNFQKRFSGHSLSALVGQEYGRIHTETIASSAYNTPYPGERNPGAFLTYGTYTNQQSGIAAVPAAAAPVDKAPYSIFGEVNDSYKEKHLASASLRRDASTNFGKDNRYGTFYSFGAGWLFSKENFMGTAKPVTNAKLRAAYGTSGREAGADYLNFSVYTDAVRYSTTTTTGSTIQRLGNDQITWETTYTANLGLDLELWKRINFSFDYCHRRSTDLLQTVLLPSYIGFPSQIRNIGESTNKGFEFSLSAQTVKSRTFAWTTDFTISFNKNRLTKIYGDSLRDGFAGTYYRYVGVNPDNGRPLFERIGPNKSVTIVGSLPLVKLDGLRGYQVVGSATPKFFGGFTSTFTYKAFTVSVLFNFSYGNKIFNNALRNFMDPSAWQSGFNTAQPDKNVRFWQGTGAKNRQRVYLNGQAGRGKRRMVVSLLFRRRRPTDKRQQRDKERNVFFQRNGERAHDGLPAIERRKTKRKKQRQHFLEPGNIKMAAKLNEFRYAKTSGSALQKDYTGLMASKKSRGEIRKATGIPANGKRPREECRDPGTTGALFRGDGRNGFPVFLQSAPNRM